MSLVKIYKTGGGGSGGGVTQIIAGDNITLNPSGGTGVVTITAGATTIYQKLLTTNRYDNLTISGFSSGTANAIIQFTATTIQNTVISGLVGASDGRIVTLINTTISSLIILELNSTASTATNTFFNPDSTPLFIRAGEALTLIYDGVNDRWALVGVKNYQTTFQTFDDFYVGGGTGGTNSPVSQTAGVTFVTISGAGTQINNGDLAGTASNNNSVGCLDIELGIPALSRGCVATNRAFNGATMANGSQHIYGRFAISPKNTALINNGLDLYRIWLGFGDGRNPSAGAYWEMDNSAGSTQFYCVTDDGAGTIIRTPSAITYTSGDLINLGVYIWRSPNTLNPYSHTCFYYSIDGYTYEIAADHTTGMPTGGTAAGSPCWGVFRTALGTNVVGFYMDYFAHNQAGTPLSVGTFR